MKQNGRPNLYGRVTQLSNIPAGLSVILTFQAHCLRMECWLFADGTLFMDGIVLQKSVHLIVEINGIIANLTVAPSGECNV